jgi:hypothetical protein
MASGLRELIALSLTTSTDHKARVWRVPRCQALIDLARTELPRDLTDQERTLYFLEARSMSALDVRARSATPRGASMATLLAMVVELTVDTRTETRWRVDRGSIMDIRTAAQPKLRPIIAAAALLSLALTFASWPAAAQQWTPQQRAACEPDAMRLCNQYVPDVQRVSACMSHYRRHLSPACRAVFQGGAKKKVRRFRR